ncbi:Gfo/Idh/MocA family oxidoreductase [candidate division KSB1 bacterium]|nr:Gfo/Idh/MocA family oxidoreductase [candidate division KSB1 bacterium]
MNIGVIGYGDRIAGMVRVLSSFDIPFKIAAITDPRAVEIRNSGNEFVRGTVFYDTAEELLTMQPLDGVMIGTRCQIHAEMACKVAPTNIPLFLEKPVATSFEQVKMLHKCYEAVKTPVIVSFPLRVSPIATTVKEIIDSGHVGTIEHVVAFNDVPYGTVYFNAWYRDFQEVGGLFLQKATHDFDYINYLLDSKPKWICAMNSQRIYGGDKPVDLKCKDCDEQLDCPESPFNAFYVQSKGKGVKQNDWQYCVFSKGLKNEDSGSALLEYESGVQVNYSQNFFARHQAARRGARLYGYKGTIEFDWYKNTILIYGHQQPKVETIDFSGGMSHFGGDIELCHDFLLLMQGKTQSRTPISAGITSALTCLWARESVEKRKFCEIVMP